MPVFNCFAELRQAIHREAEGPLQKKVLKGTRWLLLKNSYNLNEQKNEKERLKAALSLNKPLATAYYLKEDLRQVWSQVCRSDAETILIDWVKKVQSTGIAMLIKFAKTLLDALLEFLITMITLFQPVLWKVLTIKSKPFKGRLMDIKIWNSLNSKSSRFTKRSTL